MDSSRKRIHIYKEDPLTTNTSSEDAYKVESGTVHVFIAPIREGRYDRMLPLCDVETGRLIPTLNHTDGENTRWFFILAPEDEAELIFLPGVSTSVLRDRFSAAAGRNMTGEDFPQRMIEFYRREELRDRIHIGVDAKNNEAVQRDMAQVIIRQFGDGAERLAGSALYRAIEFACRSCSITLTEPEKLSQMCGEDLTVPAAAKASRFACREVTLERDWFRRDCGAIVGSIGERPVACVPRGRTGYTIYYGDEDRAEPLTAATAETVALRAYVLCRTLPDRAVGLKELIAFGMKSIRGADLAWAALLGLAGALIGLLLPALTGWVYDRLIPRGDAGQLVQI